MEKNRSSRRRERRFVGGVVVNFPKKNSLEMSSLPDDIILNILSRLPVKDLLRFRCVCKPWGKLIRSPDFVKMHLNHSLENENEISLMINAFDQICTVDYINDSSSTSLKGYEAVQMYYPFKCPDCKVEILGICNGLVCIAFDNEDVILIWNPSTQEYKKIPTLVVPIEISSRNWRGSYGFGYDCKTEDYKIVRILSYDSYYPGFYDSEVNMYSLRSNSWKRVQKTPFHLSFRDEGGVFVNGALHWIAGRCSSFESEISLVASNVDYEVVVVSFNIGSETFKVVPQPEHLSTNTFRCLVVLGGCLCMIGCVIDLYADLWMMKDYGVTESWTNLFTIAQQTVIHSFPFLIPIHSFKNGEILLQKGLKSFVLYNPNHERARIFKVHGVPKRFMTETFVRSLVSPNLSIAYKKDHKSKKKNKKKRKKNKKRC